LCALAQESGDIPADVEIITEPPPQPEPIPGETPPTEPTPTEAPPAEPPADVPPKPEVKKKQPGHLRVWGGIGFGFGTNVISIGVAPAVSYIFKKIVEPGVSVRYEYTRDRRFIPNVDWHTVGGSLFVRIYPIPSLFAHIEGEIINTGTRQGGVRFPRQNLGNLLLGGGFVQGVGRGAFVVFAIKFPVFRTRFYPTAAPIISGGAGFAF
jgi:hypothetical protein